MFKDQFNLATLFKVSRAQPRRLARRFFFPSFKNPRYLWRIIVITLLINFSLNLYSRIFITLTS